MLQYPSHPNPMEGSRDGIYVRQYQVAKLIDDQPLVYAEEEQFYYQKPTVLNGFASFVNYPFEYAPSNFFPQGCYYPQFQEFDYFVVMDFEATCDKEKKPNPQEIIEFPSVVVNGITGELEDCFQTYVKPTCNQVLSDFCKELTGIQQSQVDGGVTLSEALLLHDDWLEKKGIKNTNFAVVTWSNWDCRVMLASECRYKNIPKPPYFDKWINLRVPFNAVIGSRMRCNLKEAVEMAGLAWRVVLIVAWMMPKILPDCLLCS